MLHPTASCSILPPRPRPHILVLCPLQVPWLRADDVDDLQLQGVVTMGLLGTLEEVGWQIRDGVHRIWQGERDTEAVVAGAEGKEQAALVSILYHTLQLEKEHGPARGKPSALLQQGGR